MNVYSKVQHTGMHDIYQTNKLSENQNLYYWLSDNNEISR